MMASIREMVSSKGLTDEPQHTLFVIAVDTEGNMSTLPDFSLAEVSPYEIVTLEGHTIGVTSVAFSPDGTLLASGSSDFETGQGEDRGVRLWDVEKRTELAALGQPSFAGRQVAFSPDGASLASVGGGRVSLWDVESRKAIATLEGSPPVSFSPGGDLLASGGGRIGGEVRLWDVTTQTQVATLKGHTSWVNSVAFSSDGALLASASHDSTVKLWDVVGREEIATLEGHTAEVTSVSFSPGGALLASGGGWGEYTVRLWDVTTQTQVATLEGEGSEVTSVSFSPDGALLASGSRGFQSNRVILFDVSTGEILAVFSGHLDGVTSVAFSPDGALLASGSWDRTIKLYNVSQWTGPRPFALEMVSGDGQQGSPGAVLAHPLVVEVRDQYGDPLPDADVTFAVTAGGGRLSARTATTGSDGRASTTLTLGRTPGTNTVRAGVAGLEPVAFTVVGLAVPRTLAKLSGDEQQAAAGAQLAEALVVSVQDQNGSALPGVVVTFAVLGDGGTLSAAADTTDADGLASTALTLGEELGTYSVRVTVPGLEPLTFIATAKATPDFDGDGVTDFSDFFLFAEAFGGTAPRFDLDGNGVVDFTDFFLFAESFGESARAKLVAMATELIGLPDGPQLQQNAPNPFNSGTVISWFQLQPGSARLEVFALTGQRVAVLHEGTKKAGLHHLRWDARDDQGRPLASGVFVYRLVTSEAVHTRKLTLLR